MKKILNYLKVIMEDTDGYPSYKRYSLLFFIFLFTIGYFSDLFFGFIMKQEFIDALMFIIIAGLGFTGAEKFAPRYKDNSNE